MELADLGPFDSLLADWRGLIAPRPEIAEAEIEFTIEMSVNGGSCPIKVGASDGKDYWLKALNNPQGPRVPIVEQVVGRMGALVGAPVCPVKTLAVTEHHAGYRYFQFALEQGIAHGSESLDPHVQFETRFLSNGADDDNARRHLQIAALFNWCWGGDAQWMVDTENQSSFHSHDHGYFLPCDRDWQITETGLRTFHRTAHVLPNYKIENASEKLRQETVAAYERITRQGIASALSLIPQSWPINNPTLESIGAFLEARRDLTVDWLQNGDAT